MVGGKRRIISVENINVDFHCGIPDLFTNREYPWHLYIIIPPEEESCKYNSDGWLTPYVIQRKYISFKYSGLTCKASGDTISIHIRHSDTRITVLFDRVMTIEEIAHFLESEIIPNTAEIKRMIILGAETIRREKLGLNFGIISRTKRAM
jgi:hypothetical protein